MKKVITGILSALLFANACGLTAMAETPVATVSRASTVLSVSASGVSAEAYEYQWYHSNTENGTYTPIYKQTGITYNVTPNDIQTYIRAEVTPILAGGAKGTPFMSNTINLSSIGALSRTGYTDDRAGNKENKLENMFTIGGENLILLDEFSNPDEAFYVMTGNFKGRRAFSQTAATAKFDVNSSNSIAHFLNNDFLTTGNQEGTTNFSISSTILSYIPQRVWWTEAGASTSDCPSDYSQSYKIGLLSRSEYSKYWGKFGWDPNGDTKTAGWWLRTSRGNGVNTANDERYNAFVAMGSNEGYPNEGSNGWANTWNKAVTSTLYYIRPTFYLNKDIFKNLKATNIGSNVKKMLTERYSAEELSAVYNVDELLEIGFEINAASISADKSPAAALTTLTADYTASGAVSYQYQWLKSASADGPYYEAYKEVGQTYLTANDDKGLYIKVRVTPVYADGRLGTPVTSINYIFVETLGRLSRTDYSTEEREANKNNPTVNYVEINGEKLLILNEYADPNEAFYVMAAGAKGRRAFDADNTTQFDAADSNNVAHFLNNAFLTEGNSDAGTVHTINAAVQAYIPQRVWWTEAGASNSNSPSDYSTTAKIGLLSRSEYTKYWGKFGWDPNETIKSGWWLRTGRGTGGTANSVFVSLGVSNSYTNKSSNSWANTWDKSANTSGTYYLRPTFYLNEDIFRNLKANVSNMGSDVKQILLERYTAEELSGLYTAEELRTIGFEVSTALITADKSPAVTLTTLTAEYAEANAASYLYQWIYSDAENGTYKEIYKQNQKTYLTSNEDKGRYIKVKITPVYAGGTTGSPIISSNAIYIEKLNAVGRTNYSAAEREANKDNPTSNFFYAAGERLLLLEETNDPNSTFYVMTAAVKGRHAFDPGNTSKFDIEDTDNIAYLLNHDFLDADKGIADASSGAKSYLSAAILSYLDYNHVWWTEPSGKGNATEDYSYTGPVSLLSRSEYTKYWGKFGWDPQSAIQSGWWLRTARDTNATNAYVALGVANSYPTESANAWGNTWDKDASTTGYYIRPTFWLNNQFFLENKVEVSTMGAGIKQMLTERYTKEQLKGLYSDAELGKIGFHTIVSIPDADYGIYTRSAAVVDVDYTAGDTGDIIITYTNGTQSGQVTEFLYLDDVYQAAISMIQLPYGRNNVTVTLKDFYGTVISETKKMMYIIPDQTEEAVTGNGVVVHPAQLKLNMGLLSVAKTLGFTNARIDFSWAMIETQAGVYDFSLFDSIMAEADRLSMRILPILDYNNTLYSDNGAVKGGINTEAERIAFVNYAKAIANRYPQIDTFEVWNEPNSAGFWQPAANAADYSALLTAVSSALYAINPNYTIYAGSIDVSKSPYSFVENMFANNTYDLFDALSYHPYFHPYEVNSPNVTHGAQSYFEEVRIGKFMDLLLTNGGFKGLAATEIGFSADMVEVNGESVKARETVKAIVTSNAYNLDSNYVFNLKDESEKFGVLTEEMLPNELMYSMAQLNSAIGDAKFLGKLDTTQTTYGYVYVKNNQPVAVCWSTNNDALAVTGGAAAYDLNGNHVTITNNTVALTKSPVYIYGLDGSYLTGAANHEKELRMARITSRYPSVTAAVLTAANAKEQILADNALSEADKSAALFMHYEMKKVGAIYQALTDASNLNTPTARYEAVIAGNNIYSKAALKLAKDYIDENNRLANSQLASKNNLIAANNAILADLLESAELLGGAVQTDIISGVSVTGGILTFSVNGAENADIWVAVYGTGQELISVEKADQSNLRFNVGNYGGKIFVWNNMNPLIEAVEF